MDHLPEIPPSRKGLPHGIPHWVRDEAIWFVTLCARDRGKPILTHPDSTAASLLEAAKHYHDHGKWYLHLILLMPDHLHALITFGRDEVMTKLICQWKSYTAKQTAIRWQRDFFDHRLRSNESYAEKAAYIRNNPVRAHLIDSTNDWPWIWEPPIEERQFPKIPSNR